MASSNAQSALVANGGVKRIKMKKPQAVAAAQLRQHALTMVGRVLNVELQEEKVKAFIAFMPTVWECAGRAKGYDLGRERMNQFET
ncbi:unnamed protein product [Cochlearia groenlandica]